MMAELAAFNTSFETRRINATTFVICEDDAYGEQPLIFAKLHPTVPVLILSDTGCDEPRQPKNADKYIGLRAYLECVPVDSNNGEPLNPGGRRQYIIICTHCHYDHIGGIAQFLAGGTTEIVASAAGRDFIETDLDEHSLFRRLGKPVPDYKVTKWTSAFERLAWPFRHKRDLDLCDERTDLGITIVHTPGHTPDELAWYDHSEMHLYVGDSFYEQGSATMAISWPPHGNLVEWAFSMQKLLALVQGESERAATAAEASKDNSSTTDNDWVTVSRRVLVSCGHVTTSADAEDLLIRVERFWQRALHGEVPVTKGKDGRYDVWKDTDTAPTAVYMAAPGRLMDDARRFFGVGE